MQWGWLKKIGRAPKGLTSRSELRDLAELAKLLESETDRWSRRVILEEVARQLSALQDLSHESEPEMAKHRMIRRAS